MNKTTKSPAKRGVKCSEKGRRKLDFCHDRRKPLQGIKVFLDVLSQTRLSEIRKRIETLGGTVEEFLSREITLVVTNQRCHEKVDSIRNEQTSSSVSAVPSPLQPHCSNRYLHSHTLSPFSNDSPVNSVESRRKNQPSSASRARNVVNQAKYSKASVDVASKAKKLGAKLMTLEEFTGKYMRRKSESACLKDKRTPSTIPRQPRAASQIKERKLAEPFFKVEIKSKLYRPIYHEFKCWPKIYYGSRGTQCPFSVPKETPSGRGRIADAEVEEVLSNAENSEKCSEVEKVKGLKVAVNNIRKPGYCDCCNIRYEDMKKHVRGQVHRSFARDSSNYEKLNELIEQTINFEDFTEQLRRNVEIVAKENKLGKTPFLSTPKVERTNVSVYADCQNKNDSRSNSYVNVNASCGHEGASLRHKEVRKKFRKNVIRCNQNGNETETILPEGDNSSKDISNFKEDGVSNANPGNVKCETLSELRDNNNDDKQLSTANLKSPSYLDRLKEDGGFCDSSHNDIKLNRLSKDFDDFPNDNGISDERNQFGMENITKSKSLDFSLNEIAKNAIVSSNLAGTCKPAITSSKLCQTYKSKISGNSSNVDDGEKQGITNEPIGSSQSDDVFLPDSFENLAVVIEGIIKTPKKSGSICSLDGTNMLDTKNKHGEDSPKVSVSGSNKSNVVNSLPIENHEMDISHEENMLSEVELSPTICRPKRKVKPRRNKRIIPERAAEPQKNVYINRNSGEDKSCKSGNSNEGERDSLVSDNLVSAVNDCVKELASETVDIASPLTAAYPSPAYAYHFPEFDSSGDERKVPINIPGNSLLDRVIQFQSPPRLLRIGDKIHFPDISPPPLLSEADLQQLDNQNCNDGSSPSLFRTKILQEASDLPFTDISQPNLPRTDIVGKTNKSECILNERNSTQDLHKNGEMVKENVSITPVKHVDKDVHELNQSSACPAGNKLPFNDSWSECSGMMNELFTVSDTSKEQQCFLGFDDDGGEIFCNMDTCKDESHSVSTLKGNGENDGINNSVSESIRVHTVSNTKKLKHISIPKLNKKRKQQRGRSNTKVTEDKLDQSQNINNKLTVVEKTNSVLFNLQGNSKNCSHQFKNCVKSCVSYTGDKKRQTVSPKEIGNDRKRSRVDSDVFKIRKSSDLNKTQCELNIGNATVNTFNYQLSENDISANSSKFDFDPANFENYNPELTRTHSTSYSVDKNLSFPSVPGGTNSNTLSTSLFSPPSTKLNTSLEKSHQNLYQLVSKKETGAAKHNNVIKRTPKQAGQNVQRLSGGKIFKKNSPFSTLASSKRGLSVPLLESFDF